MLAPRCAVVHACLLSCCWHGMAVHLIALFRTCLFHAVTE